jgi:hypothetical protein
MQSMLMKADASGVMHLGAWCHGFALVPTMEHIEERRPRGLPRAEMKDGLPGRWPVKVYLQGGGEPLTVESSGTKAFAQMTRIERIEADPLSAWVVVLLDSGEYYSRGVGTVLTAALTPNFHEQLFPGSPAGIIAGEDDWEGASGDGLADVGFYVPHYCEALAISIRSPHKGLYPNPTALRVWVRAPSLEGAVIMPDAPNWGWTLWREIPFTQDARFTLTDPPHGRQVMFTLSTDPGAASLVPLVEATLRIP